MIISGEVEFAVSLAMVAIGYIIFRRIGVATIPHDMAARGYRWPLQPPLYAQIWFVIAVVLILAGMFLFAHSVPRLRVHGLWGLF
jgi:hypothetical protein